MRKISMAALLLLFIAGCATAGSPGLPSEVQGEPTVFCDVVAPPDPLLMGGWKIIYVRYTDTGQPDSNPVKYWLVKYKDKYALYFDRITRGGRKRYLGWKDWTINGNQISSDTGVTIFTKDGGVYYSWQGQKPGKMERIGDQ